MNMRAEQAELERDEWRKQADDLYGVVEQCLVWLDRVEINLRNDEHVAEVMGRYEARQR